MTSANIVTMLQHALRHAENMNAARLIHLIELSLIEAKSIEEREPSRQFDEGCSVPFGDGADRESENVAKAIRMLDSLFGESDQTSD